MVVGGDHGDDQATLMQRADVAMYEAKRQGAGVVVYASSIDTNSPERLAVLSELRHAVEEDQLVLHFQPLVSLSTGEVEVAEALVRWNHPTRGLLAPADFVPAAEQTGLISVMTRHILERSLEQVRRWRQAGLTLPVSVNVSARNIADPRLVSDLSALLAQYDVPAYLLRLEITESAIIADPDRAAEVLAAVNRLGVGLAIDDFGAGYTSFAQLHGLRVSELKIDHSYVTVMDSHASSGVIVRSLIDLGHNLGLTVTAEGVESLDGDARAGQGGLRPRPGLSADARASGRRVRRVGGHLGRGGVSRPGPLVRHARPGLTGAGARPLAHWRDA